MKNHILTQLAKYKISADFYTTSVDQLLAAGFRQEQAEQIIFVKSSTNTITFVLQNYKKLLDPPYGFSYDQIVTMTSCLASRSAIKAVIDYHEDLKSKAFTNEQIVTMASVEGSAKAIKAIVRSYATLKNFELSNQNMVELVSRGSGGTNISCLLVSHGRLKQLNFTNHQIVAIASKIGGAGAMKTVLSLHAQLKSLDFTNQQIALMASHHGGARALEAVLSLHAQLKSLDFTNQQIVLMASHHGAAEKLQVVLSSYQQLKEQLNLTNKQITTAASSSGGVKKIETMLSNHVALEQLMLNNPQIQHRAAAPDDISNSVEATELCDEHESESWVEDLMMQFNSETDFSSLAQPIPLEQNVDQNGVASSSTHAAPYIHEDSAVGAEEEDPVFTELFTWFEDNFSAEPEEYAALSNLLVQNSMFQAQGKQGKRPREDDSPSNEQNKCQRLSPCQHDSVGI